MAEDLAGRLERSLSRDADHVALREQASAVLRRDLGFDLAVWARLHRRAAPGLPRRHHPPGAR